MVVVPSQFPAKSKGGWDYNFCESAKVVDNDDDKKGGRNGTEE